MDLSAAVRAYHALLDEGAARESFALLEAGLRRLGLPAGPARERPPCDVLRPRLLAPAQYALLKVASAGVGRAVHQVAMAALANEFLLAPAERELLAMDRGHPGAPLLGRLDGFLDPEGRWCAFVGASLEAPVGIAYDDALVEIFRALPAMRAFVAARPVHVFELWRRLHHTLREAWRAWGGSGAPALAIVAARASVAAREAELLRARFAEAGTPTLVADPDELRYDGATLYVERDGRREAVELVYRLVARHELVARHGLGHPLVRAYADGRVCVVNPLHAGLARSGQLIALLSDERGPGWAAMDDQARAAARTYVPWTRLLRPGSSTYQDEPVDDLPAFVAANRERLLLKPCADLGDARAVRGWAAGEAEWRAAIASALRGAWVVQERVPVPEELYPTWSPAAGLRLETRRVGSGPCFFITAPEVSAAGCLTRLAGGPGAGDTVAPTFLLV